MPESQKSLPPLESRERALEVARPSATSGPPSDPRPRASRPGFDAGPDDASLRPARAQMIALLVLGFVLVAVPLYLWRRPRALPETDPALTAAPSDADAEAPAPQTNGSGSATPAPNGVRLGDPQVLECHDPGPKHTPPEQCDRLPELEKALAQAVTGASGCVPRGSGGAVVLVADVSYARKKKPVSVTAPAEGRTVKATVASACATAVGQAMQGTTLDAHHAHQRYKVRLVATWP